VLLELARAFGDSNVPPGVGIDIVFLDGAGAAAGEGPSANGEPLGAKYFAQHLSDIYGDHKPVAAIVLDAVCRRNLRVQREQSSLRNSAAQVEAFWRVGQGVDRSVFSDDPGPEIDDDQTPLIRAGIPSILIVDSEYPRFAASGVASGKCNAQSLETIGQSVMNYITLPTKTSGN
jgi:Zn-dependent M28 family amino/carboxypeptidase